MKNFTVRIFILLFSLIAPLSIYPQSFSDNENFEDGILKIFWRSTSVKPKHDNAYGGWTFNIALATNSIDKGESRIRYENPTLGDFLFVTSRLIRQKPTTTASGLDHAFGGGFFGWFQYHINLIASDRFILSPGFSLGDYIFGFEYPDPSVTHRLKDPAGYYFHAGPALLASYSIQKNFWVEAYSHYDIPYAKAKLSGGNYEPIEKYAKPHFLAYGLNLHYSFLYTGFRMNHVLDRGSVGAKGRRLDINAGIYF